jgi:hypothetical protein
MSENNGAQDESATPEETGAEKQPRRFRRKLREELIEIENENGLPETFIVREMTGEQREMWQDTMSERRLTNAEGYVVGIKHFKDMQPGLIARCLYTWDGTKAGRQVSIQDIRKFPSETLDELYEFCLEVCALTSKAADEVKKA